MATITDAIENIEAVRASIKAVKGEKFLLLCEIMATAMRRKRMHQSLLVPVLQAVGLPHELLVLITAQDAMLDTQMVSAAARMSGIPIKDLNEGEGKELVSWAERLVRVEQDSMMSALPPELRAFLDGKGGGDGKG